MWWTTEAGGFWAFLWPDAVLLSLGEMLVNTQIYLLAPPHGCDGNVLSSARISPTPPVTQVPEEGN